MAGTSPAMTTTLLAVIARSEATKQSSFLSGAPFWIASLRSQ
jgi:hypothetical protein